MFSHRSTVAAFRNVTEYARASRRRMLSSTSPKTDSSTSAAARVLLVGSGRMGHIRADLCVGEPRLHLCGIVDPEHSKAMALASTYHVNAYNDLERAIEENSGIEGLIVSSPTMTHHEVVKVAARHGIHVFTEKPVDETASKIEAVYKIAETANIHLCCSFQRRFDPSYVAFSKAVHEGEIGRPITGTIFFADHPCPPKEFLLEGGGDIFMDLSAHDVDFIQYVLQDDECKSVYATGTSSTPELAGAGVHDNATMVMTFRSGVVVTLFMGRFATYGYDQRCEIFGTDGMVQVTNPREHATVLSNSSGIHQSRLMHSFPQRFRQAFGLELQKFASVLLDNEPWPVTKEQCVKVQRVADAARLSCDTGEVVHIPKH